MNKKQDLNNNQATSDWNNQELHTKSSKIYNYLGGEPKTTHQ